MRLVARDPADGGGGAAGLLGGARTTPGRPTTRPRHFPGAGITILNSAPEAGPEIWCRCDAGPLGFLAIAAHGHADALSVEVRHGGVEILADPGTYCYHGEPEWRSYFRSTRAHNALELDGTSQAVEAGPFMWSSQVTAEALEVHLGSPDVESWRGRHHGYERLPGSPTVERTVRLHQTEGRLEVVDQVRSAAGHEVRLFFHLGPAVDVTLSGERAVLSWAGADGEPCRASLELPAALTWSEHRGETDPVLGWYSPRFGERVPTSTLLGVGPSLVTSLVTTLTFEPAPSRSR